MMQRTGAEPAHPPGSRRRWRARADGHRGTQRARARHGAAGAEHRCARSHIVRGWPGDRRVRCRHPLHPGRLDPGQRRQRRSRTGHGAAARRPGAERQSPIFLMASRKLAGSVSVETATLADEYIWILADTAPFIAGRVQAAIERYLEALLPPMQLRSRYEREREYSWAAPGHQGGVAFLKSPVGGCSSISTARTCFAPTWASSVARSARCSATAVRSARASATSRASSAPTAHTRC